MAVDQNKELARQMVDEILNKGNYNRSDELISPDFIEHEELPNGIPATREGALQMFQMLRKGFPDFKATIEDMIAEDDKVVMRMKWTGTHKEEFMGIPASGRNISLEVIDVLRIADGKFTEHWGKMDSMVLMEQLGALPAPSEG